MKIIAVANQKGGVGKTTVAWNLAAELSERGFRVLAVDLDAQCNLTIGVGLKAVDPGRTIYQVIVHEVHPEDVIVPAEGRRRFDLLPGSPSLTGTPPELANQVARETRLKEGLALIGDRYDVAILDCPPHLELPTVNALVACDVVLVPVQAQQWAYEGLGKLRDTISIIQRRLNPRLHIGHIVPNMVTRSRAIEQSVIEAIAEFAKDLPGDVIVHAPILDNVRVAELPSAHLALCHHDRSNPAADGFERLADRIAEELRP